MMKLPRFRLHLSTAIVLMFVVGGLVWVNSIECRTEWPLVSASGEHFFYKDYGWPIRWLQFAKMDPAAGFTTDYQGWHLYPIERFMGDIAVWLGILAFTWAACETFAVGKRKP